MAARQHTEQRHGHGDRGRPREHRQQARDHAAEDQEEQQQGDGDRDRLRLLDVVLRALQKVVVDCPQAAHVGLSRTPMTDPGDLAGKPGRRRRQDARGVPGPHRGGNPAATAAHASRGRECRSLHGLRPGQRNDGDRRQPDLRRERRLACAAACTRLRAAAALSQRRCSLETLRGGLSSLEGSNLSRSPERRLRPRHFYPACGTRPATTACA